MNGSGNPGRGAEGARAATRRTVTMWGLVGALSVFTVLHTWRCGVRRAPASNQAVRARMERLAVFVDEYVVTQGVLPRAPASTTGGEKQDAVRFCQIVSDAVSGCSSGAVSRLLVDPWGQALNIYVDSDGDGAVRTPRGLLRGDVVIWSNGPNGTNEFGGGDDQVRRAGSHRHQRFQMRNSSG